MKIQLINLQNPTLANCWLAVDEKTNKAALCDVGWYYDIVGEFIKKQGVEVEYILLTHGHFDHLMGAKAAAAELGAKIAIHALDKDGLSDTEVNLMGDFRVDAPFEPTTADIILNDGDTITIGESTLKVMHTPGHSAGSVCFIDEEGRNILSGDTVFYSTVGRTDLPTGSDADMYNSLKKIVALEGEYNIYPGHGPETTLSHERVRNIYIRRMNRN